MNNALITGGAGFIGFHLAKNLINIGYRVDIIDNFHRGVKDDELLGIERNPKLNIYDLDLLNTGFYEKVKSNYEYIFHLAAIVGVKHVLEKPFDVLTKNVELLINVLKIGKLQDNLHRFIFFSTSEVCAGTLKHFSLKIPTPECTPITLADLKHNRTSYMLSKIYGEALCSHSGLPVTIIRPHNIYGPRMGLSHVIPELLKKAYESEDYKLDVYSVNHTRTFCYIDDAVEMIRLLAESENGINQTFNVGNQEPEVKIGELSEKIIKTVGKEMTINPKQETHGSPVRRSPDMTKTNEVIGYQPTVGLDMGIKKTFEWYKDHVFINKGVTAV